MNAHSRRLAHLEAAARAAGPRWGYASFDGDAWHVGPGGPVVTEAELDALGIVKRYIGISPAQWDPPGVAHEST